MVVKCFKLTHFSCDFVRASAEFSGMLLQHCSQLRILSVVGTLISMPTLVRIIEQCKQLRTLYCSDGSHAMIDAIIENCPFFEYLNFDYFVTTAGPASIDHCPLLRLVQQRPSLVGLSLTVLNESILQHCTKLEVLNLSWINLSDNVVQSLSLHCKNLEKIIFYQCSMTSTEGTELLFTECSKIQSLTFWECDGVTNTLLEARRRGAVRT